MNNERTMAEEIACQVVIAVLGLTVAYIQGRMWGVIPTDWEARTKARWRDFTEWVRDDEPPAWRFTEVMDDARAITKEAAEHGT